MLPDIYSLESVIQQLHVQNNYSHSVTRCMDIRFACSLMKYPILSSLNTCTNLFYWFNLQINFPGLIIHCTILIIPFPRWSRIILNSFINIFMLWSYFSSKFVLNCSKSYQQNSIGFIWDKKAGYQTVPKSLQTHIHTYMLTY